MLMLMLVPRGTNGDKYANSGLNTNGDANTSATNVNKYKYASVCFSANISAPNIDENKDVGGSSNTVIACEIGGNKEKQLKLNKLKILVTVIRCKRSHLLKKTLAIKLSEDFFIAF